MGYLTFGRPVLPGLVSVVAFDIGSNIFHCSILGTHLSNLCCYFSSVVGVSGPTFVFVDSKPFCGEGM